MFKKQWKSPYERNFNCFAINDFKKLDSVTVYLPKEKRKIRGVITDINASNYEIVINTKTKSGIKSPIDSVIYLKEYDKNWLK
jgi:hypothetical protein